MIFFYGAKCSVLRCSFWQGLCFIIRGAMVTTVMVVNSLQYFIVVH